MTPIQNIVEHIRTPHTQPSMTAKNLESADSEDTKSDGALARDSATQYIGNYIDIEI